MSKTAGFDLPPVKWSLCLGVTLSGIPCLWISHSVSSWMSCGCSFADMKGKPIPSIGIYPCEDKLPALAGRRDPMWLSCH